MFKKITVDIANFMLCHFEPINSSKIEWHL